MTAQHSATDFTWQVPTGGFQWVTIVDPEVWLAPGDSRQLLVQVPAAGQRNAGAQFGQPLKDAALFRQFGDLAPAADDMKDFANTHGLLGLPPVEDRQLQVEGELLSDWQREIDLMAIALKVWDSLRRRAHLKLRRLEERVHIFSSDAGVPSVGPELADYYRQYERPDAPRSPLRLQARDWLGAVVNDKLSGSVDVRLRQRDTGRERHVRPFERSFVPQTLLAALWLQFATAIAEAKEYRECGHCGKPFEVSLDARRTNSKWCGDACKSAAYRARQ